MLRLLFQPLRIGSTFVSLIVVTTTPWMVIMMLGYVQRRGYYLPDAMQVFNRGQTGGPYWFYRGWNLAGVSAWIVSSLVALLTVNIPGHFVGWVGNVAGDIDVSLTAALILPTLLYPICVRLFAEPHAVYGPSGPRLIPAHDLPVTPVVGAISGTKGYEVSDTPSSERVLLLAAICVLFVRLRLK